MKNFLEKANLFIGFAIFGLMFLSPGAAAQKPKMATEMPVGITAPAEEARNEKP